MQERRKARTRPRRDAYVGFVRFDCGSSTKAMQFTRFHTASIAYLSDSSAATSPSHFDVSLAT